MTTTTTMIGRSRDDWPGLDKERFYFATMVLDVERETIWADLRVRDETERERACADRLRELDAVEKSALTSFEVDLISTAAERDEAWIESRVK